MDAALAGCVSAQGLVPGFDAADWADPGKAAEQGVDGKRAACMPQSQSACSRAASSSGCAAGNDMCCTPACIERDRGL